MKNILPIILLLTLLGASGCSKGSENDITKSSDGSYVANKENIIDVFNKNQDILSKNINKKDIAVVAREGYSIFSAIISNNKDRVVYTELKGDIDDWEYHISIKDIKTGDTRIIYSYPESTTWKTSLRKIFAKDAKAIDCQGVPIPLRWTKNDKKIIFEGLSPVSCVDGSKSGLGLFIVSTDSGVIEPLRYIGYFNDYSKGVVLESGKKIICNSMNVFINEKVVARDIETDSEEIVFDDSGYHYRFLGIDTEMNILNIGKVKIYNNKDKGCYEFVSKEERVEVMLDKFNN